jgi:hypothetical protein
MAFNVKASYETDTLSLKRKNKIRDQHRKGYVIEYKTSISTAVLIRFTKQLSPAV